jgi:hypothetical protein
MKTRNIINIKNYLTWFLQKILNDDKIIIKGIEKNKIIILNSYNIQKSVVLGIKVLKCYTLKDLYEMQLNFFNNLKTFLAYEINDNETHVFFKEGENQLVSASNIEITEETSNINYEKGLSEIYNYICSIIAMSLGNDFELEEFLPNQYRFIVHYIDKDYLIELDTEFI